MRLSRINRADGCRVLKLVSELNIWRCIACGAQVYPPFAFAQFVLVKFFPPESAVLGDSGYGRSGRGLGGGRVGGTEGRYQAGAGAPMECDHACDPWVDWISPTMSSSDNAFDSVKTVRISVRERQRWVWNRRRKSEVTVV